MITSTANKKIREVAELSAKAKERRRQGLFPAEGVKLFLEAPREKIRAVYIEESFYQNADASVKDKLDGLACEIVSAEVFTKISDTKTPQGILAVIEQTQYSFDDLLGEKSGQDPLLLILEDIQDPGNLGTMLRTAEGAGVSGVMMTKNTADIFQPKAVRSTMGSIYRVPFLVAEDLRETIGALRERKIRVYAAYLGQDTALYDEYDYTVGSAFLIGNEGNGLKEDTAALADCRIRIPMQGSVESLNAAMAAGILMYEAARQRKRRD